MATYSNAFSRFAKQRLLAQYGIGAKRYGAVASWITMLKAGFYDFTGNSLAVSMFKSHHPAQLHYGIWDHSGIHSFDQAIRRATTLVFQAVLPGYKNTTKKIVHFGSGFGGVDIQLCQHHPHVSSFGISIDPLQVKTANELATLYGLNQRAHFIEKNFLHLDSFKEKDFDGGMAIESLCHVPEKQLDLLWKNVHHLLKPGARFVIHDAYLATTPTPVQQAQLDVFIKGWDLPNLPPASSMIDAAKRQGFQLISNKNLTPKIHKSAHEIFMRALIFKPFVQLFQGSKNTYLQSLGLADPETIDFANTGLVQKKLFADGVLEYRQLIFEKNRVKLHSTTKRRVGRAVNRISLEN